MLAPNDYYLNTSLYEIIEFTRSEYEALYNIIYSDEILDSFCVECGRKSTFQPEHNHPGYQNRSLPFESLKGAPKVANQGSKEQEIMSTGLIDLVIIKYFTCARVRKHNLTFISRLASSNGTSRELIKIGQFPSIADIAVGGLDKYKKILGQEKSSEFYKAIGLYAHGVGIGSFPYLRRIFEDLIEEAHDIAKTSHTLDETEYPTRMEDKILSLQEFLPSFLVTNRSMYSILSKGIHELTEDECLSHFELMKEGIEAILDEKLRKEEEEKRNKRVAESIGKVAGSMK